jgi:hypothetical protein
MGRKPVLGLVGACLASVAFVGCDHPNLLQQGGKKDVATTTNNNSGWKSTPQGSQTGGPATNNSGATGSTVANTSGSFNVNPRGPVGDYPEGRSMPNHPSAGGEVDQVAYPGTSSAHMKAISPNPDADPGTGGLPPLTKPLPTGTVSGGTTVPSSPGPSTLPPLTPPGPAHPRVDTFPAAPTGTRPVVAPTTGSVPTSGAPEASSSAPMPPLPATPADAGSSTDLPPVPPLPPVSQSTKELRTPPLPSAPGSSGSINPPPPPLPSASAPTGMGIPAAPTRNPASFQ